MKKLILAGISLILFPLVAAANENNQVMSFCLEKYGYDKTLPVEQRMLFDFTKSSKCYLEYKNAVRAEELAELRDFLKHNPRYRVPGQSLNRCYGKPREMPFERSSISVGPDGMHASVWYKDKLPAGCFENAPWDNRDKK